MLRKDLAIGAAPPAAMRGVSLLPEIEAPETGAAGGTAAVRSRVFSEYNGQQFGLYTQRMIRDARYKFIWNPTDRDELCDLHSDPWELENLAADHAHSGLVTEYRRRLYQQFNSLGDPMVQGHWMRYSLEHPQGRS